MLPTDDRNDDLTDSEGQGATFASVETKQSSPDAERSQNEGTEDRERKAAKAAGGAKS